MEHRFQISPSVSFPDLPSSLLFSCTPPPPACSPHLRTRVHTGTSLHKCTHVHTHPLLALLPAWHDASPLPGEAGWPSVGLLRLISQLGSWAGHLVPPPASRSAASWGQPSTDPGSPAVRQPFPARGQRPPRMPFCAASSFSPFHPDVLLN